MKVTLICEACGSPDVLQDAWTDPNDNDAVVSTFDNFHCPNCEGECSVVEIDGRKLIKEYEIIASNPDGDEGEGFNLYSPRYGDEFLGHFDTFQAAQVAAFKLAGERPLIVRRA